MQVLGGLFDLDRLEEDIADYENQMLAPDFWDDNDQAQETVAALNQAKETYHTFNQLEDQIEELDMALALYSEDGDGEILHEAQDLVDHLSKSLSDYQTQLLLSGDHDGADAILEIHPGAGGTESQDWGSMLLRMYQRWADQEGYRLEVIDYQAGDEAGLKSVTLEIKGQNAYGFLQSEKGVHRLVRISPFDSNSRRHTSFASVEVTPVIDESVEVDINPEDLRIDTYRASGAGGQHINKTDSAVRITHIPTGIITQSQAQRSQFQNKDQAMALLRAKLFQVAEEERQKELAAIKGEQLEIGWGSQIRSYVFHPYSMVKDHRTDYEVGNTQAVMDGDLNGFMEAYLRWSMAHSE